MKTIEECVKGLTREELEKFAEKQFRIEVAKIKGILSDFDAYVRGFNRMVHEGYEIAIKSYERRFKRQKKLLQEKDLYNPKYDKIYEAIKRKVE